MATDVMDIIRVVNSGTTIEIEGMVTIDITGMVTDITTTAILSTGDTQDITDLMVMAAGHTGRAITGTDKM